MKLIKFIALFILCVNISALSFYVGISSSCGSKASFYEEKIQKQNEFALSTIQDLDISLSNISKADYENAQTSPNSNEKVKFCVVTSSYNNIKYATQNINSLFRQNYYNWKMVYFDDASNDGMSEVVIKIKQDSHLPDNKFIYIRNKKRMKSSAYNNYQAAHHVCNDKEIMVFLDGADLLATNSTLKTLAKVYEDSSIWMT